MPRMAQTPVPSHLGVKLSATPAPHGPVPVHWPLPLAGHHASCHLREARKKT